MTYHLSYYRIAILFNISLNSIADISYSISFNCLFYSLIQCLFSSIAKISNFFCNMSYTKCIAIVSMKTILFCSAID